MRAEPLASILPSMSLKQDACQAIGELFIMGFNGLEIEEETAHFIKKAGIGGVILFSANYEGPAQAAELSNQIQDCRTGLPLWVSADHEGGRVQRFRKGFTKIPEAAAIGAMNSPKLAFEIAEIMAKELKAVGVNLNYAPIADILTHPKNPVIGNRAFGTTEEEVSRFCTAIVRGHLIHGVQPCVKHFPGHGDTSVDSHFALPSVTTPIEVLHEREFKPFLRAFKAGCNMVMTAHILIPALDPKFPTTLSQITLQNLLRNELRFQKLIISDDLEMKAISDHYGVAEAPRLAMAAGCDLLIYRTEAATHQAYEALTHAVESGTLAPEIVLTAADRSRSLKREVLLPYHAAPVTELAKMIAIPEHLAIVEKVTPLPGGRKHH